jgi:hypothetical protein
VPQTVIRKLQSAINCSTKVPGVTHCGTKVPGTTNYSRKLPAATDCIRKLQSAINCSTKVPRVTHCSTKVPGAINCSIIIPRDTNAYSVKRNARARVRSITQPHNERKTASATCPGEYFSFDLIPYLHKRSNPSRMDCSTSTSSS